MTGRAPGIVAVAAIVGSVAIIACGEANPTLAPTVPATLSASPTRTPPPPSGIDVDLALIDVLPLTVDGIERLADPDTAAEIASSVDLAASVESIAVAIYVGPGSSAADDLAIVSVARLRPDIFSDAWFRQWRETYDAAACEPAGGVQTGSAQAEIGGVTTYIGSCRNLVHTYHVRLADPDRVVAITALGEARLGERIVAALTE
ncbi:hypothetical protein BH20CHL7_BH20CHL7_14170 [soil metagenome]